MKKLVLSLFTTIMVLSGLSFSMDSASAASHDRYTYADYKKVKLEDHVAYRGNTRVVCTISQWYIRSVTKCRLHEGETTISEWAKYDIRHSHVHN